LRHIYHECGHRHVALHRHLEIVTFSLDPNGESQVQIGGFKTLHDYYLVGVAGLLAEAKGMGSKDGNQDLYVEGMGFLARRIYKGFNKNKDDKHGRLHPHVPLRTFPPTMWAQINRSDLAEPIVRGLDEGELEVALVYAAELLNGAEFWSAVTDCFRAERHRWLGE
jgi:hypothetical protein